MNFTRIVGKIDDKLVSQAETKLSQVFLELGTSYSNKHTGTCLGGDPLIFSLMYPTEHICTLNMPTAATDGKRFYWNPKYVIKKSKIGLRIICSHESTHALYLHPQRRGSRLPKLWNIAVDYIVNGNCMDDLKARGQNASELFVKHCGRFCTLKQYMEMLKDPFKPVKGFEDVVPGEDPVDNSEPVILPAPNEDRELTPKEMKELEKRESAVKFYFADPDLEDDMRSPEKIYDLLYSLLPKCPKCGRIGFYKRPQKDDKDGTKKGKGKGKGDKKDQDSGKDGKDKGQGSNGDQPSDQHNHGGDQPCDCDCPGNGDQDGQGQGCDCEGCPECGGGGCGGFDVFGLGGGTVDEHYDTEESQEKMAKKISEAMESARRMAGHVPAGLEDELGKLTAPKITWQDIIRCRLLRTRTGNGRNDWTRFKTRPMFSGLLVPKRKDYFSNFGCLLDCSGSMSKDDIALGLSQLVGIDDRGEGTIVPCDSEIYFDKATKIKKCNVGELSKVKVVGRGGTCFSDYFLQYEKHIGKVDFHIIITDGYLLDSDIAEMKDPQVPVYWIITNESAFRAPFGRAFSLFN